MRMREGKCPECGSTEVRSKSSVSEEISVTAWSMGSITLVTYVCVDCGAVRAYIDDQRTLEKIGEKWDKVRIES